MTPSQRCIDLVKSFEGCRLQAYQDIRGIWTIGWGHTGTVEPSMVISQEQADAFLQGDLTRAAYAVGEALTPAPNQNQFDALTSFQFNTWGLKGSTLQRLWNRGEQLAAADQFLAWNKSIVNGQLAPVEGLTRRRQAERALFLEPMAS